MVANIRPHLVDRCIVEDQSAAASRRRGWGAISLRENAMDDRTVARPWCVPRAGGAAPDLHNAACRRHAAGARSASDPTNLSGHEERRASTESPQHAAKQRAIPLSCSWNPKLQQIPSRPIIDRGAHPPLRHPQHQVSNHRTIGDHHSLATIELCFRRFTTRRPYPCIDPVDTGAQACQIERSALV